jgi:hypothetical protein
MLSDKYSECHLTLILKLPPLIRTGSTTGQVLAVDGGMSAGKW